MNWKILAVFVGALLFGNSALASSLYFPIRDKTILTCHFCGYYYKDGSCHGAIDIDTTDNSTKIYAADEGEVIWRVDVNNATCKNFPYGNHLIIRHPTGYTTLYAHLKQGTIKVKVGDRVKAGDELAVGDNTGCSSGSHLHFEVKDPRGKKVDPYDAAKNHYLCLPKSVPQDCGPNYLWATCPPEPYDSSQEDFDQDNDGFTVSQGDCNDQDKTIYPGAKELCDGIDNDCDQDKDEDFWGTETKVGLGDACSDGWSDCRVWGKYICSSDKKSIVCDAMALPPGEEICDGLDNNCDGRIDEDIPGLGEKCAVGEGACRQEGVAVCLPEANPPGLYCSVAPLPPDCSGKQCGDDGCGGSCGECVNSTCFSGSCVKGLHLWSKQFGSMWEGQWDRGMSVSVDSNGNAFITGYFRNWISFGGEYLSGKGMNDIFLAKFDADGNHLWSKGFGSASSDFGYSVSTDNDGNVFMTGAFVDTVNFGGEDLTSAGNDDIFLVKFDADGNHLWSKEFGSANSNDEGRSVSVDNFGNVFVTGRFGRFGGTVNFGGEDLTSAGNDDIFLVKFDADGNHLWSKGFGSASNDEGRSVSADSDGNVFMTGAFVGTVNFGGEDLGGGISPFWDMFLVKFDADGNHLWSKWGDDYGNSVSSDNNGNIFVTGGNDISLAKFDAGGNHLWSKEFGSANSDEGLSVSTDNNGNAFMTGAFVGTVNFGGEDLTSAGDDDIFLAKFDAGGNHLWSKEFGSANSDEGLSVSTDNNGNVFMTGLFTNVINFGGKNFYSSYPDTSDIFLVKFAP